MFNIKVNYRNREYVYPQNTTLLEISKEFKEYYKFDILAGIIDGKVYDLSKKIERDTTVEFMDLTHMMGNRIYERGLIFLVVKAVKDLYNRDIHVNHSADREIFFKIQNKLSTSQLAKEIETKMLEIVNDDIPFEKASVDRLEAIEYFNNIGRQDKAKSLKYVSTSFVSLYRFGQMYDYYFGEMPSSSRVLKYFKISEEETGGFVICHPRIYENYEIRDFTFRKGLMDQIEYFHKWRDTVNVHNVGELNEVITNGQVADLIYLGESNQNHRLWEIAKYILDNRGIRMIMVSGPSSSGKTTTSKKLGMFLRSMGLVPHVVSTDDYFLDRSKTPRKPSGEPDFESIYAIDVDRFNNDIKALINGQSVTMPAYNFLSGKSESKAKELKIEKDDILIIEGLHAHNDALAIDASMTCKFKLYVSMLSGISIDNHNIISNTDIRLLRRIVRDHYHRGYRAADTLESWQSVRTGEETYVFHYLDKADIVFNTFYIYEIAVLKLYAEPLLYSVPEDSDYYAEAIRLINILKNILPLYYPNIPQDSIIREFIGNSYFEREE